MALTDTGNPDIEHSSWHNTPGSTARGKKPANKENANQRGCESSTRKIQIARFMTGNKRVYNEVKSGVTEYSQN